MDVSALAGGGLVQRFGAHLSFAANKTSHALAERLVSHGGGAMVGVTSFTRRVPRWKNLLRFYWNKVRYGFLDPFGGRTVTLDEPIDGIAMLREIRVDGHGASG